MLHTYFPAIFLVALHLLIGDSHACPYVPPEPYPCYIVLPQCSSNSGSIFSNDPGMIIFTNTFAQCVYGSDILREVLDLSETTPLQFSQFVYKYNLDYYKTQGLKNAASIAEFAARGITNLDVLTLPLMVKTLHNTAGNFLFVEGILKVKNAETLAFKYAEIIENFARANLTEDPTSKFKILGDSFFKFILSVDKNIKTMIPLTSYYFGNEWFVALVNYKQLTYQ